MTDPRKFPFRIDIFIADYLNLGYASDAFLGPVVSQSDIRLAKEPVF